MLEVFGFESSIMHRHKNRAYAIWLTKLPRGCRNKKIALFVATEYFHLVDLYFKNEIGQTMFDSLFG